MKRLFPLFVIPFLSCLSVFAQVGEHRNDFSIGFNGGMTMSNVGFMPEVPQDWHNGITGGITLRYTCEKYFNSICAIVGEVNYAQVGWKESIQTPDDLPVINTVTGLPEKYQRDLTYIQIPVFARMGWGRERRGVQFFVQAGPQVGFFLNEKTKKNFDIMDVKNAFADGTSTRTSSVIAQDTMSVQRKIDYGISAGAGLELSLKHVGHFLLEGRYYYGLGDIFANSKRDYFGRSNLNIITVKLTYLFDITRTKNSNIK